MFTPKSLDTSGITQKSQKEIQIVDENAWQWLKTCVYPFVEEYATKIKLNKIESKTKTMLFW